MHCLSYKKRSFFCEKGKFIIATTIIFITIFFYWQKIEAQNNNNIQTSPSSPSLLTRDNLQKLIQEKNEELKRIEAEKQALQEKLESIYSSKNSLNKEIESITYQISQLNLKIKANKLATERLELEIQSSNEEIKNIRKEIAKSKETIAKLMIELQQKENESLLFLVLSSNNLSDSINKTNAIYLLNKSLTENVQNLASLEKDLQENISLIETNKLRKELEEKSLLNNQNLLKTQREAKNYILTQTKNQEKLYEEQMRKLEEQQLEISKTIERIESELKKSFNISVLPQETHTMFSFPVENPVIITQRYGYTKFAERAYRTNFHTGIDFSAPLGTPIYAVADGIVKRVDNNDRGVSRWSKYQYGKYILIQHSNNLTTLYAHLSQQLVKNGDVVKRGDLIGYSGNSGYTFGPHLHFGVYYTPQLRLERIFPANGLVPLGITIDPLNYLPNFGFILRE